MLDLCFVMPAFLFLGAGLLRHRRWALLMAPGMLLGSSLMASLTIAEFAKPMVGQPINMLGVLPLLALAALLAALAAIHLHYLQLSTDPDQAISDLQPTTRS